MVHLTAHSCSYAHHPGRTALCLTRAAVRRRCSCSSNQGSKRPRRTSPQSRWQTMASPASQSQHTAKLSGLVKPNSPCTGAQALVSWSLKQSTEGTISMVAEEDSDDLRFWPPSHSFAACYTSLEISHISLQQADLLKPGMHGREKAGQAMAESITSLVNEVLPSGTTLTCAEVLDYIDVGRSPGGSEVRPSSIRHGHRAASMRLQ